MDSYEKYEIECKKIRKQNVILLDNFENWLSDKNLSKKTITKHSSNAIIIDIIILIVGLLHKSSF